METIVCKAQHTEDRGFAIASSTQGQTLLQSAVAYAFDLPSNKSVTFGTWYLLIYLSRYLDQETQETAKGQSNCHLLLPV